MRNAKILSLMAAATMSLGLAGAADARVARGHHKKAGLHGRITTIDSANQFTITTGGKKNPHTVQVSVVNVTHIKVHKKPGTFQDLKVGDTVKVQANATHPTLIEDEGSGRHHKKAK